MRVSMSKPFFDVGPTTVRDTSGRVVRRTPEERAKIDDVLRGKPRYFKTMKEAEAWRKKLPADVQALTESFEFCMIGI